MKCGPLYFGKQRRESALPRRRRLQEAIVEFKEPLINSSSF
jgi:hypothetical protein